LLLTPPLPPPPLFPYTTLFRSLSALATLTSMIMIGLGFLYRPGPATLLWSSMFVLVTLSAYATVIAGAASIHLLGAGRGVAEQRSEEHTSELQSRENLVCRLLL